MATDLPLVPVPGLVCSARLFSPKDSPIFVLCLGRTGAY